MRSATSGVTTEYCACDIGARQIHATNPTNTVEKKTGQDRILSLIFSLIFSLATLQLVLKLVKLQGEQFLYNYMYMCMVLRLSLTLL